MTLPNQTQPVMRVQTHAYKGIQQAGVGPSDCSFGDKIKCGAAFAGLIVGPCDPIGFPEDLPLCIPAFGAFMASCEDCATGAIKTAVCAAVSEAQQLGIPIPSVLSSFCS